MRATMTLGLITALASPAALALPQTLNDWLGTYGGVSDAGVARCQLCHADVNGGAPWNAYGWDLRLALDEPACDADGSGQVTNGEAFACVEPLDSDEDSGGYDNASEIVEFGSQPGWRLGECNTLFSDAGEQPENPAPAGIDPIDPPGTDPVVDCDSDPGTGGGPGPRFIYVEPGESIQEAIDAAGWRTTILVRPGVYREDADPVNGLTVTKSGLEIVGLTEGDERAVLEPATGQRNGIVVVPSSRTDCMSCHVTMAPPFTLHPGVVSEGDTDPVILGFDISGITIRNFVNNGLFTERVDRFSIVDVESVDNRNYGIFPTLSSNGLITDSYATGADDSGIWVETSENVVVSRNLVEDNVNGFEVSNSDNVLLVANEARNNTVGMSLFVLTDLVDVRPGANNIVVALNWIHDNNRANTGSPGSLLSLLPFGSGLVHLGVDNSRIVFNRIENNGSFGIAVADYCLAVTGTSFACDVNPPPAQFDAPPRNNRIVGNVLVENGTAPDPSFAFSFAAADLTLFTLQDFGNCYAFNSRESFFGFLLPPVCGPL